MRESFQFERRLLRDIRIGGLLSAGDEVVVAVSGGPDSMALLTALRALGHRGDLPLRLCVAHLNHRLRGAASDRDALFVAARARAWGLPVYVGVAQNLEPSESNLEERARDQRGRFLRAVAHKIGTRTVALGHTLDDQAETVLHRLARGGGMRGLAAMQAVRGDGVVRPLLRRRREECARYLASLGVSAVEDASNRDRRFTRNRLRHEVLPELARGLGVDVSARLAALADDLRVESALADQWVARVLDDQPEGSLAVAAIVAAGPAGGRLIHAWLRARGVRATRSQVEAVVQITRDGGPSTGVDLTGVRVERRYDLLVCRAPDLADARASAPRAWAAPGSIDLGSGWRLWAEAIVPPPAELVGEGGALVDAARVEGGLTVRNPLAGDRIRLRAGRRKLSDVFIDARIPRVERLRLAVVTRGADIIWVPGVAVAASVLPGTKTERWMRLGATRADCRDLGSVLETQEFRVQFG